MRLERTAGYPVAADMPRWVSLTNGLSSLRPRPSSLDFAPRRRCTRHEKLSKVFDNGGGACLLYLRLVRTSDDGGRRRDSPVLVPAVPERHFPLRRPSLPHRPHHSMRASRTRLPRPFLKWAGGKSQLLDAIVPIIRDSGPIDTYHEPFVGGGAVYFELFRLGLVRQANLSDLNEGLIETYRVVRDETEHLLCTLVEHKERHDHDYYYRVRSMVPATPLDRAARIIYLNKTCFNGLFRENSRGLFNVPLGAHSNPMIADHANLRSTAHALRDAQLAVSSFDEVVARARSGDLVYFDPPYDPLSATSSFTAYSRGGFGAADQERLASVVTELTRNQVRVVASNSSTDLIRRLYAPYRIRELLATRAMNSVGSGRGKVLELLISNF